MYIRNQSTIFFFVPTTAKTRQTCNDKGNIKSTSSILLSGSHFMCSNVSNVLVYDTKSYILIVLQVTFFTFSENKSSENKSLVLDLLLNHISSFLAATQRAHHCPKPMYEFLPPQRSKQKIYRPTPEPITISSNCLPNKTAAHALLLAPYKGLV